MISIPSLKVTPAMTFGNRFSPFNLRQVWPRGLSTTPEIAVGDGALGFWKAVDEVFPGTRHQRCWLHKAKNLLNKVPKSIQEAMKADIREISAAPTRAAAELIGG